MTYFREAIEALEAYEPGEQPDPTAKTIKLNTNENPYPPSPRAVEALRATRPDQLRRYPAPRADEFRRAAAEVIGVAPSRILVGNGSDDILTMLFRSVTDPTHAVAYPVPTYVLYRTLAQMQAAPVVEIPFDDAFTLPVDQLAQAQAALTLVANPNSPSGTRAAGDRLASLAERLEGLLVIDEAYVEFADGHALELTARHDNVVILRTLSKSHSLAGLRVGFAIASPSVIAGLAKVKDSYNVDAVACRVGAAAIRDTAHTASVVERVKASRARLTSRLERRGFRVWPSEANFLLVAPPGGDARGLYQQLKTHNILVRYFDTPGLDDKLRVTVGTDEDHRHLMAAVDRLQEPRP